MLSTDNKILEEGTPARARMAEYAAMFRELHVVVLSRRNSRYPIPNIQKENQLFIYSTNSKNKISALWDAYKIGKKIFNDNNVRLPRSRKLGLAMTEQERVGGWVITSQDPFELGLIGYLLKKKFGVPLQLQTHTDFMSPYFWHESLKNQIRVMLAKWLLPKVDGIRVVSERIRRSLTSDVRRPTSDIQILPIFVDAEKIRNASIKTDLHKKYPQFDFIILMASRLSAEKNIGLAIGAMADVLKNHPRAGLVVVGEGPEMKYQISNIKYQKLESNIMFEPWTEDLASYYKTADLFLLTSLYEGYGRTVVEAMASGAPILMTDVGVAGDLVKDGRNGFVVSQYDKRGLMERIIKLIEDKRLRDEFGKNNSEAVKSLPNKAVYLQRYKAALEKIYA